MPSFARRETVGTSEEPRPWREPAIVLVVVCGLVLATFWPALSAGALYMDDKYYLGPVVRHPSWASVRAIFGEVFAPSMVNGYYQPLSLLSLMFDALSSPPGGDLLPFHRTSLLLHVGNVALVATLLRALFGRWREAGLLALLYGLHPLNADAVLWVAERKTVLSTFFALISLVFYVQYAQKADNQRAGTTWRYVASLVGYLGAVLSKPTTLPLAVLLPVLDYWPLKRLGRRSWREKLPFLAVCLASAVVTVVSQSRSGDVGPAQFMRPLYIPLIVTYGIGFYLVKLLYPAGLVSDYAAPEPFALANPSVMALAVLGALALVGMALSGRRTRAWLAGGLFFLLALFPTLGIVRFTWSLTANRSVYFPMIGLLLPLAWHLRGARDAAETKPGSSRSGLRGVLRARPWLVWAGGAVLAASAAATTVRYERFWSDSVTLLEHFIREQPDQGVFYTRLGNEWIQRRDYPRAIEAFGSASRLNPTWAENHLNLGRALFTVGQFPEARQAFAKALSRTPGDWRAHMLMGMTLGRLHELDGALKEFAAASSLAPASPIPHFNMGNVLEEQGKGDAAAEEYRQTLRIEPRFIEARQALEGLAKRGSP